MGWLRHMFSRRRRYDELSESIREHLDEKIADLMDRGMTRDEGERVALREFGNVTRIEERSREVWQWPTLESIWADVRFALRQLRKAPGVALLAILTLALVLLCYKLDTRLQVFRRMDAGMVVPWLHERQHRYFRRPATTPDELS